jgi:hypothetical protein
MEDGRPVVGGFPYIILPLINVIDERLVLSLEKR